MNLPKIFEIHLKTKGSSKPTVKNYLSDLNHFFGWLELKLKSRNLPFSREDQESFFLYFTEETVEDYKNFLRANQIPTSTTNRRLSTLRTFSKLCLGQGWLKTDPLQRIDNLPKQTTRMIPENLLQQFAKTLKEKGRSDLTIKNYLVDIRQFLTWMIVEEKL
mgnify:FL=1